MFSFYRQFSLLLVAFRRLKFFIDEMQILLHLFLDCILFSSFAFESAYIFHVISDNFVWYGGPNVTQTVAWQFQNTRIITQQRLY